MKKLLPFLLLLPVAFLFYAGVTHSGGSIGGKTGSPGDGLASCFQCHSDGNLLPATGWITTNIPETGYSPDQTYTITVTGTHPGVSKMGFEATVEDESDAKIGTLLITDATRTKFTNGNNAVTHTSNGTTVSGESNSWSYDWTAPADGSGPVTFYAAINAANGNGGTSGDQIYLTNVNIEEGFNIATNNILKEKLSVYPNPTSDYLHIDLKDISNTKLSYQIITIDGEIKIENSVNSYNNIIEINVSDLENGMYILKLVHEDQVLTQKIMID